MPIRAGAGMTPESDLIGIAISGEDLDRPAQLTIWPFCAAGADGGGAKGVEPRDMPSLRQALDEAFAALRAATGSPWIITDSGLILTPASLLALLPHAAAIEGAAIEGAIFDAATFEAPGA